MPNIVSSDLRALARKTSPEQIARLEQLAKSGSTETVRLAAIQQLLDRGYGKPVPVNTDFGGGNIQINIGFALGEFGAKPLVIEGTKDEQVETVGVWRWAVNYS